MMLWSIEGLVRQLKIHLNFYAIHSTNWDSNLRSAQLLRMQMQILQTSMMLVLDLHQGTVFLFLEILYHGAARDNR